MILCNAELFVFFFFLYRRLLERKALIGIPAVFK